MTEAAFIAIGSNIDPEQNLPAAVARLSEFGEVVAVSIVYQTPAIGPSPAPDYLNAAALVRTELEPLPLRERLRRIEADLGRVRTSDRYAPRTIDLDLCLYGSLVLATPELTLPDPGILERAYLAVCLAELDPEFVHPATNRTLEQIAERLRTSAVLRPRTELELPR